MRCVANGNKAKWFLCENDERFFVDILVLKGVLSFSLRDSPARVSITLKAPPVIFSLRLDTDLNSPLVCRV